MEKVVTEEKSRRRPTKERILDAAERLFAERGFENVTTRDITQQADANLASVNYHFGSKINLMKEVFQRRAKPLNNERLKLIREAQKAGASGHQATDEVLKAFLEPSFHMARDQEGGQYLQRIMSQLSSSPKMENRQLLFKAMNGASKEFLSSMKDMRNDLSEEEFYWRMACIYGVMMYVLSNNGRIQSLAGPEFDSANMDAACKYVIPFLAAGMDSPSAEN